MKPHALLLVAVTLAGCGWSTRYGSQNALGLSTQGVGRQAEEPLSLFPSDIAVLSDSAIKRILTYRLTLPHAARVAVIPLGEQPVGWLSSEDFTRLNEALTDSILTALKESPRVSRAALLPTMLVPRTRTIPYLREAAARYQADLLLGYRTNCTLFHKFRILRRSLYRSVCSVEAILLDTRTGIVPFTAVASRAETFARQKRDFDTREAIINAQFQTTSEALSEVAKKVQVFLATAPETEP